MLSSLLPGLRSLRVALISGALIVGSLYLTFGGDGIGTLKVRKPAQDILALNPHMPELLAALLCLLVGSLYATGLEGVVDWIHRRMAPVDLSTLRPLKRVLLRPFAPLSTAARNRIVLEAARFYDEYFPQSRQAPDDHDRNEFIQKTIAEILWLKGKLSGTALAAPYDEARSEGHLQLAIALLLPPSTAALAYAVRMNTLGLVIATVGMTALAIKLADYGLYYFRAAHSFLAHHVADGVLLAPSMETMRRMREPVKQRKVTNRGRTK